MTTPKIIAMFKLLHHAIVAAKLRRSHLDLMLHRSTPVEFDAARLPQRPLLLGDKWDF